MKNIHTNIGTTSLDNTDFYKKQCEQSYTDKTLIDMKRKKDKIEKNVNESNYFLAKNIAYMKALNLSIEFITIAQSLMTKQDYTILSPLVNQCVRSSTSIAANLAEAAAPVISAKDRIYKMSLSFKECVETIHWCNVLYEMGELTEQQYAFFMDECTQITKILSKTISTLKRQT